MSDSEASTGYDLVRARWKCRRGMLELDYLQTDVVEQGFATLSEAQKADFVRLLGESDQDLQRWLVAGHPMDDTGYRVLIERIIERAQFSSAGS